MSIEPRLVTVCLLAEGFPPTASPSDVARFFYTSTKTRIAGIAPLNGAGTETSSGWLLLLLSHDDQIRCLMNHKTFDICYEHKNYNISLNYPEITLTSYISWETVMAEEDAQMDSVASEDLFGGENISSRPVKDTRWNDVHAASSGQRVSFQRHPGPQDRPQTRPSNEPPVGQMHTMRQGSCHSSALTHPYPHGDHQSHPPFVNPDACDGKALSAGQPPGRPSDPELQDSGWSLLDQLEPVSAKLHTAGHGGVSVTPGEQQSQERNFPGYPGNPDIHQSQEHNHPGYSLNPKVQQSRERIQLGYPGNPKMHQSQERSPGYPSNPDMHQSQERSPPSYPSNPDIHQSQERSHPGYPRNPGVQQSQERSPGYPSNPDMHQSQERSPPSYPSNPDIHQSQERSHPGYPRNPGVQQSQERIQPGYPGNPDMHPSQERSPGIPSNPDMHQSQKRSHAGYPSNPDMHQSQEHSHPGYPGNPDMHQSQNYNFPGYTGNPGLQENQTYNPHGHSGSSFMPLISSHLPEGGGGLSQRMGDLNLRHDESFPYIPSFYQPSVDPYHTRMDTSETVDYQSDFVVLSDTPEQEDSNPHHHHFHLVVSDLPPSITEQEVLEFFQDRRRSGGGPVTRVDLDTSGRSAAVFFSDEQVIQRVLQKTPLLLKDKIIQIQVSSEKRDKTQPAELEIKTVEIRGLECEDNKELCQLYFENPVKGGGDIESCEWNEQDKIFFITFADPAVAKAVSAKGHKLGGKVLEVVLYTPPAEDEAEEPEPQCTVEVRGINPDQEELYEMYFSNPKKGGDSIVELKLSEDRTVMYITFETPEVAERVAKMSHTVGQRKLEVTVAPVEDPTPPCTVILRCCDLDKEETYHLYFENPKRGGGDIAGIVVDKEQQAILITFEDPEVAERVVAKQHRVGGCNLDVSLYTPKKVSAKRQKSQEPSAEEEEAAAPRRTVVVSVGQGQLQSNDMYSLYFESHRCGGGEVESIEIDQEKQLVYVTFMDPAVAERVAGRQHKIAGCSVEVWLYVPPKPKPTYPNKLLFQNVADNTTRDCLIMHLERISGMEPEEILYGDELGTVLVTFPKEPDFDGIHQISQKRTLEKRYLTVSKVPISNCLLVEHVCDQTTEDTMHLYFENHKRSGGGTVERVEMIPKENKCFVYFESHEVLDGVLGQHHSLDDRALQVKRYLQCLGQSGGSVDPTSFTTPKSLVLDTLDPFKVAFLRQSQSTQSELLQQFLQQLLSNHAQGRFERNTLIVECMLTPAVPRARILARTWRVDVEGSVSDFLGLLDVKKRPVVQQLWTEVEPAVREADRGSPGGATLFPVPEETTLVVVGMKSMAQELYNHVDTIVRAKEEEMERRKQEVTETNSKLDKSQLGLLVAIGFHVEAGKRHEGLNVDIQIQKKTIVFHGMLKEVKEAQVEMYELLSTMKSGKIPNMTDMQRKVLFTKGAKSHIVKKFKSSKISAVWEQGQQSEVNVFAFDDKSLATAIHLIKACVPEHVHHLSPESSELLRSQDWQNLVAQLKKTHPPDVLLIVPSHDSLQIFVTCIDIIMHPVVEDIERFMAENTIYSQSVCFSPSRQKLVHMKWEGKLHTLAQNLRVLKVQIIMTKSGNKINIKGTRKGLEEVRKQLEDMNQKIVCHESIFEDPRKVKLLTSDCDNDLKMIGRGSQCVLSLQPEDAQLQVTGSDGTVAPAGVVQMGSSVDMQATASVQHGGVTISVIQGDITQMAVGAIVNAANTRMDHAGGLARDIIEKGGDIIQKECHDKVRQRGQLNEGDIIVSGPGRLRCKSIIHAVGPMYKGGNNGEQDCLFDTVMVCLQAANDEKCTSIAIPAISTGIFGYPAKESTTVIVEAVKVFFESHRRCTIKSVYLCHTGTDIVSLFTKALQKVFPSAQSSSASGFSKAAARKDTHYAQPYYSSQSPSQPFYGQPSPMIGAYGMSAGQPNKIISVSVIPGEIAKQSADVIVNSTSNGLDLHNGAVSSSILKAAGQNLQVECKSKYPGGIQTGEMARTSGNNLNCREIFHIVLCNYTNPQAQQILRDTVIKCLSAASNQRYTSLAFPVLGTGNLRFPAPVVAQTMLGAVHQFEQINPSTTLRDVRIIIYPADRQNLQEFQQAQSGVGQSFQGAQWFGGGGTGARQHRKFSDDASSQAPKPLQTVSGGRGAKHAEFDIGGLRFVIKKGDITEEDTDAIVNSTNSNLDLSRGGVANALRKKCGPQLEQECRQQVQAIQNEGIAITRAYNLRSRMILHMNADCFSRDWEEGIELCFKMADQHRVRSIAMPALGTGIGLSPSASAQALFNTVVRVYKHGKQRGSLEEVRVVLFDSNMITPFINAVQKTGENHNKSKKGFFNRIKSAFTGESAVEVKQTVTGSSNPSMEKVSLYVYAEKQSDVNEALKALEDIAQERFTRRETQDEVVSSFQARDVERVMQIGAKHKAELQIQTMTGHIICDGLHKQVYDCMTEINTYIRSVYQDQKEKEAASMMANMISWCLLEVTPTGTVQKEYQPKENLIIETAYQEKKTQAEIQDMDGHFYVIDFNAMKEFPRNDPKDTVNVVRKDKIKDMAGGQVPDFWEPHSANETVKLIALKSTDTEYQTVASGFGASVANVNILNIERVQNLHLYHQYIAKKAHLEKQNPGIQNEKILWHGTSADAITNINHHGFNRSYCGKNATVHGNGVYFAINARYSASPTYSPPDASGKRCVYQCMVLVGHPTPGHQNLRVLPARQGPVLYDSATDNPNNPSMYVIFNDTQAYPEYMITFQ